MQSRLTENLPSHAEVVEVGPRDGLQSEQKGIPTEDKIHMVNMLSKAGLSRIEVTSFVSPKWVPQLADADAVMRAIDRHEGVHYSVLTPNMKVLHDDLGKLPRRSLTCGIPSQKTSTDVRSS